jgi:hypothetical protein
MANKPLKGQNVRLSVIDDTDGLLTAMTRIKNCTVTFSRDVSSEDYIDHNTDEKDSDFKGCDFKFESHSSDEKIIDVIDKINRITRGLTTGTISLSMRMRFSFGVRRLILPECEFGNLEIGVGGKAEKVGFPFEGSCSDYQIVNV